MKAMNITTRALAPKSICASERAKLIGTTDGLFPDFGHHSEREMGGLWMQPIKVLDGFWFRLKDLSADNVDTWITADSYVIHPWGNEFGYENGLGHTKLSIVRTQIAPDSAPGVLVTYKIRNQSDEPCEVEAEWLARTELYPVWFSLDSKFCEDGQDEGQYDESTATFYAKDSLNPWYAAVRSLRVPDAVQMGDLFGPQRTAGKGVSVSYTFHITVPAWGEEELSFAATGSIHSKEETTEYLGLLTTPNDFAKEKMANLEKYFASSELIVPNDHFSTVWDWVKIHTEWLTVDAQEYGRAVAAGLPEYPWWFGCDNCYTIQGLLCIGQYELARQTLKLIADYSQKVNGNGRIVHEITPFGLCPNPGNTQETAHFVTAVWHYWQWTGDSSLVEELMPLLRQSMKWLEAMDDDGDLFPSGYGIIEISGLNAEMIDTIAYTTQAWYCYAEMCKMMGEVSEANYAMEKFANTKQAMDTEMWDEEVGLYCDAYASPTFVRNCREKILRHRTACSADDTTAFDAMVSARQALGKPEAGFLINGNWVIDTPLETGLAPREKALRSLKTLDTDEYVGRYGMYLNALDHDAMMTISTGSLAVSLARYGMADRALALLERMCSTFGMIGPGLLAEMSPDYGCFIQAWTAYALYVPVVRHMFGIQPDGQQVVLTPSFPEAWPEAKLLKVRVLNGEISLHYRKEANGYTLKIEHTPGLTVRICLQPNQKAEGTDETGTLQCNTTAIRVRMA